MENKNKSTLKKFPKKKRFKKEFEGGTFTQWCLSGHQPKSTETQGFIDPKSWLRSLVIVEKVTGSIQI